MTKFRVVLLFCLSLVVPIAVFGNTLTGVLSTIETALPTNTTGDITAATLRSVLDAIVDYAGNGGTKITQSGPYLLTSADCGNAMAFSGGFYAVTLPAVTGISSCMITVKNDDATRGKTLSGFPADLNTILYPKQSATVKIVNGAWTTLGNHGLWTIPAATTFYVNSASGNDLNDGLATGSGAFKTLQKAWDSVLASVNTNGNIVTIQAQDGTYTAGIRADSQPVGGGLVLVSGNVVTPTNVLIAPTAPNSVAFQAVGPVILTIQGFYLNSTNILTGLYADLNGASIQVNGPMNFGTVSGYHMQSSHGFIFVNSNYTISGGSSLGGHLFSAYGGQIEYGAGVTVTVTGTPTFFNFARATDLGTLAVIGTTFSGGAIGARYVSVFNSGIQTGGGGANYFPGNAPGLASNGGYYN